jgi:hypothetical protein
MSIPENDNQLWKGFNDHGLYAKRTERDRDGVIIDEAYARKSEIHQLENAVSDSTDTELTPGAAKTALDGILKSPTPGAEGTMLSYGVTANEMKWDSWESEEMDIPSSEAGYKGLVGLFYGNKKENGYYTCNYLAEGGTQTANSTCKFYNFDDNSGPLNTTVINCSMGTTCKSGSDKYFTFGASSIINGGDWTAEQWFRSSSSTRIRFTMTNFGGWPYETAWESYNTVYLFVGGYSFSSNEIDITEWNHIAFEYDSASNTIYLYINGQKSRTIPVTWGHPLGGSISTPTGDSYYSTVYVQQLALWNKRLSGGADSFPVPGLYMDNNGNWLF